MLLLAVLVILVFLFDRGSWLMVKVSCCLVSIVVGLCVVVIIIVVATATAVTCC